MFQGRRFPRQVAPPSRALRRRLSLPRPLVRSAEHRPGRASEDKQGRDPRLRDDAAEHHVPRREPVARAVLRQRDRSLQAGGVADAVRIGLNRAARRRAVQQPTAGHSEQVAGGAEQRRRVAGLRVEADPLERIQRVCVVERVPPEATRCAEIDPREIVAVIGVRESRRGAHEDSVGQVGGGVRISQLDVGPAEKVEPVRSVLTCDEPIDDALRRRRTVRPAGAVGGIHGLNLLGDEQAGQGVGARDDRALPVGNGSRDFDASAAGNLDPARIVARKLGGIRERASAARASLTFKFLPAQPEKAASAWVILAAPWSVVAVPITVRPFLASSSAMAAPIPRDAPVTSATWPSNLISLISAILSLESLKKGQTAALLSSPHQYAWPNLPALCRGRIRRHG